MGFPGVMRLHAAAPIKWKLQGANPAGTPHDDLLKRWASNVDRMSGGRLKIEILPAGSIVNPFEILDGVNKGVVDAGQWWCHYATGKHPAGGLFSAPIGGAGSGLDQFNHFSWYLRGGGRELYLEYYQKILKADVMAFLYGPDGPECFGWYKRVPKTVAEYTKMRVRMSSGLPSDVLKEMGGIPVNLPSQEVVPAAERGLIDGLEWINPSNDLKLGIYDVFKNYSIQGLHQAIDIADIVINGKQWRALSPDIQAIIEIACTTSIFEALMYFVDENAKALQILVKEKGVKMFDAPRLRTRLHQGGKDGAGEIRGKGRFLQKGPGITEEIRESRGSLHQGNEQADTAHRRSCRILSSPGPDPSQDRPGHRLNFAMAGRSRPGLARRGIGRADGWLRMYTTDRYRVQFFQARVSQQ